MFVVAADVVLRYFFNNPITGSSEIVELMLVTVTFLAVAYTASEKGHITITMVTSRFPQRVQAILGIFTSLLSLGLVAMIAWFSVDRAIYLRESAHVSMVWSVPMYPFLLLVAFGCALFAIVLLANLLDYSARAVSK